MTDIRKREGTISNRRSGSKRGLAGCGLKARLYNPKSWQDAGATKGTKAAWFSVKIGPAKLPTSGSAMQVLACTRGQFGDENSVGNGRKDIGGAVRIME